MIEVSFQQKIKGKIQEYKIQISVGIPILGVIIWLIKKSFYLGAETVQSWLKDHILVLLFVIALLIISLLISFFCICFLRNKIKIFKIQIEQLKQELENKLFPEFGVYWDKRFNPYCPVCKTLLGRIAEFEQKYYSDSYCYHCNKSILMYNDEGFLTISEAQKLLIIKIGAKN